MKGAIIAIGGSGFLFDDRRLLQERYLLSFARSSRTRPRVLYLGTAAGDGERAQLKFMQAFMTLGSEPQTLPFFPYDMRRDYAAAVREADLIYVGGGNTVAMLAVWRVFHFDQALREAWEGGTALAGISAGANCWFEQYVTDSVPGGGVSDGLGWLPGTYCPHLDSEGWRQSILTDAAVLPAYGAPDGVLMRFESGNMVQCVTDRQGAVGVRRTTPEEPLVVVPTQLLS